MNIEITKHTITSADMQDICSYEFLHMDTDPINFEELVKLRDYINAYVDREQKLMSGK